LKLSRSVKIGILGFIVSGLAVIFIIQQVDAALFVDSMREANFWYLLPCVVLLLLGLVARAIRWRVLLSGRLPLLRTFSIMNVAYLVNGVLPLRIGEVARIYLASRVDEPVPAPHTASTIIVERLLDLLAVVLMVLLALSMGPVPPRLQTASGFAAVAAVAGFGVLLVLAGRRSLAERVFRGVLRMIPVLRRWDVLEDWFEQFLNGLMPLTRPRALFSVVFWTVIGWLFSIAAGYVLMFAFFPEGSLAATMLYIAAAAFAIALPAVPGNVGTYEAAILLALQAMGYDPSGTALAFAVMVHAVNVFVHASTGMIGFVQEGISLGQLSEGVQKMQQSTEAG
jgi:hypothetical protein